MHIVVFVTVSSKKEGERIAKALIQRRLCACVNITGKVTSIFRWRGKVDKAGELLLIIKSRKERLNGIIQCVKSLHSYEVPEIIAIPIVGGENSYLRWIDDAVRKPA